MKHILDQTNQDRLQDAISRHSEATTRREARESLEDVGRANIALKQEMQLGKRRNKTHQSTYVVEHPRRKGSYLSEHFLEDGTRAWARTAIRFFPGERDAKRNRDLKQEGVVKPAYEVQLDANILDGDSLGIVR